MNILFILTIAPGFFTAKFFSGEKAGEKGKLRSLRVRLRCYVFHLHHWVWSLGLIVFLPRLDFNLDALRGLLLGITLQGLTYPDFYKILHRVKKEE